ncbi:hypothetical protein ACLQ3K_25065 [Tsukamurella sp. DT100]|uniref:hypothetical protein n=1 Tax=Tsukamurella sp. DT100 TaxID=3393415 RepID=UPI003CF1DC67
MTHFLAAGGWDSWTGVQRAGFVIASALTFLAIGTGYFDRSSPHFRVARSVYWGLAAATGLVVVATWPFPGGVMFAVVAVPFLWAAMALRMNIDFVRPDRWNDGRGRPDDPSTSSDDAR